MKSSYTNFNNGNNGGFTFTAPSSVGNAQAVWNQSFADFLIGYVTSFSQSTFGTGEGYSSSVVEAYMQDNFNATRNLVLNAGVRYSYYRDPTEWILNSDNFDPALYSAAQAPTIQTTGYICLATPCAGGGTPNPSYNYLNGIIIPSQNSPFGRKMVSQPHLDFAPRFGFAYSPFGDHKTAIRGGLRYLLHVSVDMGRRSQRESPVYIDHQFFECFVRKSRRSGCRIHYSARHWIAGRKLQGSLRGELRSGHSEATSGQRSTGCCLCGQFGPAPGQHHRLQTSRSRERT